MSDPKESSDSFGIPEGERAYDDPLMDCLVLLTKLFGRPYSAAALRAGLPGVERRMSPKLFLRAAEKAGLVGRIIKRPLERVPRLVLPCVLLLEDNRACVLLRVDDAEDKAVIGLPESGGERSVDWEELGEHYLGHAILVRPETRFDQRTPELRETRTRHWFWGILFQSWRIYRDVLLASLFINLFGLVTPFLILNVYDRVLPNQALDTLWVLAFGAVIVFVFDLIMRMLRVYFVDLAGKKADVVVSAALFERVMGIRMEARPNSVGAFANSLREYESIRDFITSATLLSVVDMPFVLVFVAVMALIGGPLAYIPIIALAAVAAYGLFAQRAIRRSVDQVYRGAASKNATLVEGIAGIETIKALGIEGRMQDRWESRVGDTARFGIKTRLLSSSAQIIANFLQNLALVATLIYGVYLFQGGDLSAGGLIACVILGRRALTPVTQVANLFVRNFQARAAFETLDKLMKLPVERPPGMSFLSRPRLKGDIEFSHVGFSFPGRAERALDDVSFTISTGERVAIVGRIGSGKSTVQKLIMGLYQPQAGAVRVGGTDVRQIDPADLRRNIGYVPQDVVLFFGSLRENIVLRAPYADDAAVLRAAEISGVADFANLTPNGYDLTVGERGENLSGGQRQAVALARALLSEPPMLLFDEPTGSMDNATEQRLRQRLRSFMQGRTLVMVTHRASLLELVDRIIVLDAGKLIADGPKAEVLEALKQGRLHGSA